MYSKRYVYLTLYAVYEYAQVDGIASLTNTINKRVVS